MNHFLRLFIFSSIICIQSNNLLAMFQEDSSQTTVKKITKVLFYLKPEPSSDGKISPDLISYVTAMDRFMKSKFGNTPTATEDVLDKALKEGDSQYLEKLPSALQGSLELNHDFNTRMCFGMSRYTDPNRGEKIE